MLTRPLAMAGVLGAAVGVPYVVTENPDLLGSFGPTEQPQAVQQEVAAVPDVQQPATINTVLSGPGSEVYRSLAPVEGYRGQPLATLLRWDLTKEWVYRNWARKSTGLAEPGLFGVRAPIVTGTQMTDVAGTISYYFDGNGLLQKIRLHGTTADTTELVRLAMTNYRMQRRSTVAPGDQLYQAAEKNRVRSEMKSRPQAILWSTSPHNSFMVDLELNRPGSPHWVEKKSLPAAQVAQLPQNAFQQAEQPAEEQEEKPIFPSRALVPDETEKKPTEEAAAVEKVETPKVDANGEAKAPAEVPTDIAPLDSYRDRFRWPG